MTKLAFHQKVKKSIIDPVFVAKGSDHSTNSVIFYVVVLVIALSLISGVLRGYYFAEGAKELKEAIDTSDFPDFSLSGGQFYVDSKEPIIIEEGTSLKFIVDMTSSKNINDLIGYDTAYLLTESTLTIMLSGQSPQYYNLETFATLDFSKELLIELLDALGKYALFIMPILYTLMNLMTVFFRSIMILVLALLTKRILMLKKLRGSEVYKICLYSMTIGIVLYEVIAILNLVIGLAAFQNFFVMFGTFVFFYFPSATVMSRALRIKKVNEEIEKLK